jgi:hypothetical protein
LLLALGIFEQPAELGLFQPADKKDGTMDLKKADEVFTPAQLKDIFPWQRSNDFFDAFYGGSEDSHFDIRLVFNGAEDNRLYFSFELIQRPGKCLACNMTYGLPHVFARHPIINVKGLAQEIASLMGVDPKAMQWTLGNTQTRSSELHEIPLIVSL